MFLADALSRELRVMEWTSFQTLVVHGFLRSTALGWSTISFLSSCHVLLLAVVGSSCCDTLVGYLFSLFHLSLQARPLQGRLDLVVSLLPSTAMFYPSWGFRGMFVQIPDSCESPLIYFYWASWHHFHEKGILSGTVVLRSSLVYHLPSCLTLQTDQGDSSPGRSHSLSIPLTDPAHFLHPLAPTPYECVSHTLYVVILTLVSGHPSKAISFRDGCQQS